MDQTSSTGQCVKRATKGRRTTNIGEFAVLEDQKVLSAGDVAQGLGGALGPVGDDVAVRLEQADGVTHVFGQLDQIGRGLDVGRQAQVGALDGHELQQISRQGPGGGETCTRPVAASEGSMRRHGGETSSDNRRGVDSAEKARSRYK